MPRPLLPRLLAAAAPAAEHAADLLRRFARDGDAAAFELVVRRHATAVWTACRRILPEADAEDVFQAAFLVLARKAGSVRGPSAGGWLHRVAVTAALKRKAAGRREPTGSPDDDPPGRSHIPGERLERDELAAAVHEELARLPDRYRLPVVLCDLEGETQPAAAARLGWPVGSVAGRLSRARALLRDRLARRGFAPTGSVLVRPLAVVPARAVTAAVAAATGVAAPAASVSLLATGVLTAMRIAKLKLAATFLAAAGVAGAAGFGAYTVTAQPLSDRPAQPPAKGVPAAPPDLPPAGGNAPPAADSVFTAFPDIQPPARAAGAPFRPTLGAPNALAIEPGDDTYRRLLKARLQQYRLFAERLHVRIEIGQFQAADFSGLIQILESSQAVATELWRNDPRALDAWLADVVRYGKVLEELAQKRVRVGTDPPQVGNLAAAYRLGAEAALWKHRNPGKAP